MRFVLGLLAACLVATAFSGTASAADGILTQVTGEAFLTRDGQKSALKPDAEINVGDIIETENGARAQIVFADGTDITIGENGLMTIDDFVYDPAEKNLSRARFSILRTAFVYLSGTHTEKPNPDVAVRVDFGSIGIRGTKLYRGMRDGQCWIYLEEGAISVSNEAGVVDLTPGQLTTMSALTKAPAQPMSWTAQDLAWIKNETGQP